VTATAAMSLLIKKARRDRQLSLKKRIDKALRYVRELGTARYYLRDVDRVGEHARTLGRPRVVNEGRIEIGDHVLVRSVNVPAEICTGRKGVLRIGDGVRLNYGVSIYAEKAITIGHRVRIGPYSWVVDTDFHDPYDHGVFPEGEAVHIEDDAWIGAKCTVLKGVRIGRAAVVGTGSIVTRDVPPFTIVAGVPAKPIGTLDPSRFKEEVYK